MIKLLRSVYRDWAPYLSQDPSISFSFRLALEAAHCLKEVTYQYLLGSPLFKGVCVF